ncbi:MAG: VCBS repeat-containing protein [Flavobacteriales bacterium]|nr:VCBS repeat-containing protein [Flavobacteriales bacterium]
MAWVDMDDDADLDVLAGGYSDLFWTVNDGNGGFNPTVEPIQLGSGLGTITQGCVIADMDLDGSRDLVEFTAHPEHRVHWFPNNGTPSLGNGRILFAGDTNQTEMLCLDLDLDGDSDLVYMDHWGDRLRWAENIGSPLFGTPQTIAILNNALYLHAADVNADGLADLLVSGGIADQTVKCWINTGGAFTGPMLVADAGNQPRGTRTGP